jgi:hypothetical protein
MSRPPAGRGRVIARLRMRAIPLLAVLSFLLFAGTAAADVACGNTGGTLCCGSQVWLPIRNVAVSYWTGSAGHNYYARRHDSNDIITYDHYQYNGGNWSFDNGGDVYRGTGIYYAGQTLINFAESQVSHTFC